MDFQSTVIVSSQNIKKTATVEIPRWRGSTDSFYRMLAPKPALLMALMVSDALYFAFTVMVADFPAKFTACFSTHGREARALLTLPTQLRPQVMPVTDKTTFCGAGAST